LGGLQSWSEEGSEKISLPCPSQEWSFGCPAHSLVTILTELLWLKLLAEVQVVDQSLQKSIQKAAVELVFSQRSV
jgi:hypothetical protein